jgi:hypothetical protein
MKKIEFQCCFCGEGISESVENFNPLDPCAVMLVANWQRPLQSRSSNSSLVISVVSKAACGITCQPKLKSLQAIWNQKIQMKAKAVES